MSSLTSAVNATQPTARRRQLQACDTCHQRKVRCNSVGRRPCANCTGAGVQCQFTIVEALARKQKHRRQAAKTRPRANDADDIDNAPVDRASATQSPPAAQGEVTHHLYSPSSDPEASRDAAINEQLVHEGLVEFFKNGIGSQSWSRFDRLSETRMCYIGTSLSNLAQLVHEERRADNTPLHYPIPQIRHMDTRCPVLDLRMGQNLNLLPDRDVRDALVDSFFNDINPGFPVVDESEFRASYDNEASTPPLLLLQTILLVGSHSCRHPKVAASRFQVKMVLFQRSKALWDLRFENDRICLVQAALLFSWHVENADTVSANGYYWVSVASTIAYGLGMHRDLASSSTGTMPIPTKRLIRRVWWTLFQTAVASALDYGRPLIIQPRDSDQPPLSEDDLIEASGTINRKIHLPYCIYNSSLCEIIADMINLHSPAALRTSSVQMSTEIASRLAIWFVSLPPGEDLYMSQLQLHYNTTILHLHRGVAQTDDPVASLTSAKLCGTAADRIGVILTSMMEADTLRRCYWTSLTALLASAIHLTREIRWATEQRSALLLQQSQSQLENLIQIMVELARFWPTANAMLKLFQHVLNRSRLGPAQSLLNPSPEAFDFPAQDFLPPNWDSVLSSLSFDAPEHDWAENASWLGCTEL